MKFSEGNSHSSSTILTADKRQQQQEKAENTIQLESELDVDEFL